ncbi:hypothetical protein D3C73_452480 [compost metagenome]
MGILEVAVVAFDVGIDEPEQAIGIRQARCPDAATVGISAHVELGFSLQRATDERPVYEIAGVVDLDAGIPFEGGGGDVIILADTADGWIGVEARQDRVADHNRVSSHIDCFEVLAGKSPSGLPAISPTRGEKTRGNHLPQVAASALAVLPG